MKLFAYLGALALACVVVMLAAVSAEAQTLSDSLLGVFRPYLQAVPDAVAQFGLDRMRSPKSSLRKSACSPHRRSSSSEAGGADDHHL